MADPESNLISHTHTDNGDGTSSGHVERDYGETIHTTTYVSDDNNDTHIRASYDTDKESGDFSGAHFHDNTKKS